MENEGESANPREKKDLWPQSHTAQPADKNQTRIGSAADNTDFKIVNKIGK